MLFITKQDVVNGLEFLFYLKQIRKISEIGFKDLSSTYLSLTIELVYHRFIMDPLNWF